MLNPKPYTLNPETLNRIQYLKLSSSTLGSGDSSVRQFGV